MQGLLGQAKQPLTAKAVEASIEQNIPKDAMERYDRLVAAGMKVMFSEETQPIVQKYLSGEGEPIYKAVKGVIALLGILTKEGGKEIEPEMLMPVGLTLLVEALDFLAQSGEVEFNEDTLSQATEMFVNHILQQLGMTEERMQEMLGQVESAHKDGKLEEMLNSRQQAPQATQPQTQQQMQPGV